MMYDENYNNEFNRENPEEHRYDETPGTNFVMRDLSGNEEHSYSYSHIPPEPEKKAKNSPSLAKKVAGIVSGALLFGAVAGGTMVGINRASDYQLSKNSVDISQTAIQPAETQPVVQNSSTAAGAVPVSSLDVSSIVESAMPSVVAINNTVLYQNDYSPWPFYGSGQTYEVPSSGSGIIVGQNDQELLIVTNNHVVQDSKELKVTFIDKTSVDATIKGTDSDSDLAVIAVPLSSISSETLGEIAIATLGDSDAMKVGQGVVAIGNALGYGQSVTVGYISALDREVKAEDQTTRTLLQTDAAINPGNSGGALLNMKGEVIGINAAKYSGTSVEGIGYAIPISKAQDIIGELMNRKTMVAVPEDKQGYLGILGVSVDQAAEADFGMPKGVFIYQIAEGGAASKSDLHEKDIITKFDGQTVKKMEDLKELLTYYEGGSTVTLTVQSLDNGKYVERTVDVVLGYQTEAESE